MPSVFDVAAAILERHGEMTTMKLQKLVYYCQAWSLVWDEEPLFDEQVQAWANGPVVPELYRAHKGKFKISEMSQGSPSALSPSQHETVSAVLSHYGDKPSQWLSDLTHMERPWKDAREGLSPGERGENEITLDAMAEYYGALYSDLIANEQG